MSRARKADCPEPPELLEKSHRARRLEWITIVYLVTVVVAMGVTMGGSQAMKTAWMEDMLSLVPPISVLIADRVARRPANRRYPQGYHRSSAIAFLCGAVALLGMGLFLLYDGAHTLLTRQHPTIGTVQLLGHEVWQGWLMIAALVYSAGPAVILGRMKDPLARALHDKAIHTDADMNRADWKTALAAMAGIVGIYLGLWWADALAALFIASSIARDGWSNLRRSVEDLMDRVPHEVDYSREDPLLERVERELDQVGWVRDHRLDLREEGRLLAGNVLVVPAGGAVSIEALHGAAERVRGLHWRLRDVMIVPVPRIDESRRRGSPDRQS